MPDNSLQVPTFDLGIENSEVLGNLRDAEAFLSETVTPNANPDDLKKVEDEEEEVKKKAPEKKIIEKPKEKEEEEEPKKSAQELVEEIFGESKEEEDEEEEEAPKKKEKETKEEEENEDNQFESFSKELYKLNVLTSDEDEEPIFAKSGQELLSLLNNEKQKGGIQWIENFLSQHGEDRRELFDAIFIKGADPKEYLPVYNEAQALENIDLTQERNQEKVVREFYRRAKVSEEKIDTKIQRLKDIAELQSEAEDFHPQLLEQDKQKAADVAEAAEELNRNKLAIEELYKESLVKLIQEKSKNKDIDGLPISSKTAQEAYDFLITKKWKTVDGSLLTDFDKFILETKKPENIEKRLKIALLEKVGWDFSKIQTKAISNKSGELFNSLVQKDKTKTQTQKKSEPSGW